MRNKIIRSQSLYSVRERRKFLKCQNSIQNLGVGSRAEIVPRALSSLNQRESVENSWNRAQSHQISSVSFSNSDKDETEKTILENCMLLFRFCFEILITEKNILHLVMMRAKDKKLALDNAMEMKFFDENFHVRMIDDTICQGDAGNSWPVTRASLRSVAKQCHVSSHNSLCRWEKRKFQWKWIPQSIDWLLNKRALFGNRRWLKWWNIQQTSNSIQCGVLPCPIFYGPFYFDT